jgi:hypothetical protein
MTTTSASASFRHAHRPHRTHRRVRPVTEQEYEDLRDCCCHKLGVRRPHLAIACRNEG